MIWFPCVALFFLTSGCFSADPSPNDVSVEADRNIDIASQVIKITTAFEVTNKGKSPINSFIHVVSDDEEAHLAFITAQEGRGGNKLTVVKAATAAGVIKGYVPYRVELLKPISANSKASITLEYYLTQYLEPYPAKIEQAETQYMVYKGNAHVTSVYPLSKETTKVALPSGRLVSHTTVSPTKQEGGKITYGPYTDQKPFTLGPVRIHNENNSPFLVATEVLRHIEVSHWGNIAVEEQISLVHKGAQLKGPFSRLDFQLDRRGSRRPVVTQYKTLLPVTAKDIYYRDEIGNISTSAVKKLADAVEIMIQPRFPLFGGWRTNYVLGYNLPGYQYLYSSGSSFALKMRFMDHLFDNAVIENIKVRIILPEGSKNFKLVAPYAVKRHRDDLHFTYLDTTGRPVIVLEKQNLVDSHIQSFTLYYEFDKIQLCREPFLACAAFAFLFLIVIIFVRLDFTIVTDAAKESRMQAEGVVEQLNELHADRLRIYDHFYEIVQKYKNNKDASAFSANRKKNEVEMKKVTELFSNLQNGLKSSNPDIYEKLNEISKLHKSAEEQINSLCNQAERSAKTGGKADLNSAEKLYSSKMGEIKEKMDSVIYSI
ncbi:unnamed protein product [Enterobius vermicularis]|uniref:Dolichyl-diphosphooligosaccharide--protein glycosyltransferase subunit 1 n=1 Tax=Enterobius vermicularis TaxID=51028 RepID=A0A0N4VG59_ENTVE|nr:unnamed protein product [Enterobius vermicularis]